MQKMKNLRHLKKYVEKFFEKPRTLAGLLVSPLYFSYAFGLWSPMAYWLVKTPYLWLMSIPLGAVALAGYRLTLCMSPLVLVCYYFHQKRGIYSKIPLPSRGLLLTSMAMMGCVWLVKAGLTGFWFDSLLPTKNKLVLLTTLGLILWPRLSYREKSGLFMGIFLCDIVLGTRTGILAFLLGLGVYYALLWHRKITSAIVAGAMYVGGICSLWLSFSWIEQLSWVAMASKGWPTFSLRFLVWKMTQAWGQEHFWVGLGPQTLFQRLKEATHVIPEHPIHPHNIFLELQTSFGICGPVFLALCIFWVVKETWKDRLCAIHLAVLSASMVFMVGYLSFLKDPWFIASTLFGLSVLAKKKKTAAQI